MLKIKDLKKSYDLFQLDVSFEIPRGCITGLIGANGAGKSTIFKGILDLISIDGGTIEIFGKDYKTLSKKEKEMIQTLQEMQLQLKEKLRKRRQQY